MYEYIRKFVVKMFQQVTAALAGTTSEQSNPLTLSSSSSSSSSSALALPLASSVLSSSEITDGNMLLNNIANGVNQSYQTQQHLSPAELQLLQNEKFYLNMTQMLNISPENLTNLLMTVHSSDEELLSYSSQQQSSVVLAVLTMCYALIFLAGVLGNLITCIVISRNNFMHTATNFYLFNLAISDMILLLSGMPQDLYGLWQPNAYLFTDTICVLESVLCETAANATVLTITAFTVERYIAICHPFRQHTMSKLSRAIKFIFAIWLAAFLLALPQAMQFSVVHVEGGSTCTRTDDFFAHVFVLSGFIFFVGPMSAICVLYVLIGIKLKRSRMLQALPRRSYDLHRGISAQSRVIRMLVAVAVAFFLCWAPFHAQRLMAVYGPMADHAPKTFYAIYNVLNYTSGVLYFLSTCINPLLYNIMSHKFREAFKVTLSRQFGIPSKYQTKIGGQPHNYSALLRQNGSMRLHTTVNSNACEHFGSNRASMQFQCRDPSQPHLSLQDSVRTTTTTTTLNSGFSGVGVGDYYAGGGGSRRSSTQRNRSIPMGASQSTLMTALSKNDLYASTSSAPRATLKGSGSGSGSGSGDACGPAPRRLLQTQISQLSSLGDANSLLEADIDGNLSTTSMHTHRKSLNGAHKELLRRAEAASLHSRNPLEDSRGIPSADVSVCLEPEDAITAALNPHQPTRSTRLKLSRIIRRQDQQPTFNDANVSIHKPKRKSGTLANFKDKFRWRTDNKMPQPLTFAGPPHSSSTSNPF